MTQIEHLREQARRAERLARNVTDVVTVNRLLEASQEYERLANELELASAHGKCRLRLIRAAPTGQKFNS